jgi:hypothetical protein
MGMASVNKEEFPDLVMLYLFDLFSHPEMIRKIENDGVRDALESIYSIAKPQVYGAFLSSSGVMRTKYAAIRNNIVGTGQAQIIVSD